ncbi:histidine kinase [Nocardiopsis deserti]|uniref:histidine kinase n=1 Tax=Nocardiopsis deserti TaxID=2605988 RepID=UPI00168093DC|nr:histidine kinase [Nocardiopsis deserti]
MGPIDENGLQRTEAGTRYALAVPLWAVIAVFVWAVSSVSAPPAPVAWTAVTVYVAQALAATVVAARSLGGRTPSLPRHVWISVGIAALTFAELGALAVLTAETSSTGFTPYAMVALAVLPTAVVWASAPWTVVVALAVASALASAAYPDPLPALAAAAGSWAFGVLTVRLFGWSVDVARRVEAARQLESRLAIAEERLRFARDLHDTLGRTMTVIALKSELGTRLSDDPRVRAELEEVQHLARESQKEIRAVVRDYRDTSLVAELNGARSVLSAAGVVCRIRDEKPIELETAEQSLFGWVVREGVTNVIRHSRASYCTITLGVEDGEATMHIVNNGAHAERPTGEGTGAGLDGLAQRLAVRGGTLKAYRASDRTYHLIARVPQRRETS